MDEILHLEKEFKSKIDQSDNLHKIEQVKTEAFGKNGKIGELFKKITTLQGEDRKNFASNLNKLKDNINNLINSKISLFEQKEINNIDALLNSQVDGILISTSSREKHAFERILNKDVPLVFFDRKKTMKNVSSVTINDYEGGYKATQHLIDSGCKRIAHFSGDTNIEIFKERFLGYQQALIDNGLDYNDDYVIRTKSSLEEGKKAVKKLLKLKNAPDAIFSASDFAALGAIQELKSKGIKVPTEFSVIGFANEPFTKFMELSISTIDQFPLEMGKMTAKVFLEQVNNTENVKIDVFQVHSQIGSCSHVQWFFLNPIPDCLVVFLVKHI